MVKDYQKGKIYKVYCLTGGNEDVYYGSTVQTLAQRMTKHREWYFYKTKYYTIMDIFDKFDVKNCIIELVENYPCNNTEELRAREGYYHRNFPCVNKNIAGRSKLEHYADNRDYLLQQKKEYYADNKDKFSEYHKERYEEKKEYMKEKSKEWYKNNPDKAKETKKKYSDEHKDDKKEYDEKYREKNKEKKIKNDKEYFEKNKVKNINCICGSLISKFNKSRHERSAKHIAFIESGKNLNE